MLKIGMILENRYKILREIGRGGTGCVYLAENIRLHNYWAIKEVYKGGVVGNVASGNMLIAESHILTRLRHPCLPSIIDVMNTPQSFLIVMEYVEGVSLDRVLAQSGAQSQSDVVKWGQQLCDVLDYLHNQSPPIIYRDMKPANIMLKPDGNIVLIDFGMAREFKQHTQHDTTHLGTHGYAAPEQYNNNAQSDARTDIYSLGVTLYHLVTGHDPCLPPYGINPLSTVNPSLSPQLDQLIQKCTQLHPSSRYQTAREMNEALKTIQSGDRVAVDFGGDTEKPKKKSYAWVAALAAIPVLVIGVAAIVAVSMQNTTTSTYSNFLGGIGSFIEEKFDGTDDATLYFEQEVYISMPDERQNYTFVPEKTGYYEIYTISGEVAPVVWISDSGDKLIAKDNTSGEYTDCYITCWMEKGETYYFQTTLYDLDPQIPATGSFWLCIRYTDYY